MDKKKKRELIEWVILILVIGFIYVGGWHVQVIGKLQQAVLLTGIFQPSELKDAREASFDFTLKNLEGEHIPFQAFKGKVVFINFWATWCPPCVAEMPDIHSLYKESSDAIEFVMISMDRDQRKAIEYVKNKRYDFPVYFLTTPLPEDFKISTIPSTYVISKSGEIVVEKHGMAKYNSNRFRSLLSRLLEIQ